MSDMADQDHGAYTWILMENDISGPSERSPERSEKGNGKIAGTLIKAALARACSPQ
jgi:hypothetical protein